MSKTSRVGKSQEVIARPFAERRLDTDTPGVIEDAVPLAARQLAAPLMVARQLGDCGDNGCRRGAGGRRPQPGCSHGWCRGRTGNRTGRLTARLLRRLLGDHGLHFCQVCDQPLAGPQRYFSRRGGAADHDAALAQPQIELLAHRIPRDRKDGSCDRD